MDKFEFYKEINFRILDKKEKTNDYAFAVTANIVIISGCILYILQSLPYGDFIKISCDFFYNRGFYFSIIPIWFIIPFIISSVSLIISIIFNILSFINKIDAEYEYRYIPSLHEINQKEIDYKRALLKDDEINKKFNEEKIEEIVSNFIKKILINSFILSESENFRMVAKKVSNIKKSIYALCISCIMLVISIIPYFIIYHNIENVTKVNVVEIKK